MNKKLSLTIVIISMFAVILLTTCPSMTNRNDAFVRIKPLKGMNDRNPIMTHTFGADPTVLVYNDRVYIYMTADTLEYDHRLEVKNNSYSTINTLRVTSSADLNNWVYHEPIKIAGHEGIAKWANNSWAPSIVHRIIDDKDKFFLYFSNSANGIGVLTADSPLGPWTDPLGRALVSRQTPNCSDVPWVFDPDVFIDDDGRVYMYFGGGVPEGRAVDPGSARVVELGSDMISLAGDPVRISVPYFFEALIMTKIDGRYLLSYCTNWNVTPEDRTRLGIDRAVIAVMSSNNPMGPFTLERTIFRNPGVFFGIWGNNHHDIFQFQGQWYLAYHSQILEDALDIPGKGYRVTHIDAMRVNNGMFEPVTGTRRGVAQVGRLNPYLRHHGATTAISAEMSFGSILLPDSPHPCEYATAKENGSWLGIVGADFDYNSESTGAKSIIIFARSEQSKRSSVEIRLGSPNGEVIGVCTARSVSFEYYTVNLKRTITGVHDIFFIFDSGFILGGWQFSE